MENQRKERVDIQVYLSNQKKIGSNSLKKKLLKNNIKQHKCENCNGLEWLGIPIPIELHHINGNPQDNSLENLKILCPNCHAMTHNYRGSNMIRKGRKGRTIVSDQQIIEAIQSSYSRREALMKVGLVGYGGNYEKINKIIKNNQVSFLVAPTKIGKLKQEERERIIKEDRDFFETERVNFVRSRKVERPTKEVLEVLLKTNSICSIAKQYGVVDNSVRRWAEWYNLDLPKYPLGYWRRRKVGMSHEQALNPPTKPERPKIRKLSIEQIKEIKLKFINNASIKELSEEYGFSYECLKGIKYGRNYSYIVPDQISLNPVTPRGGSDNITVPLERLELPIPLRE